MEYLQFGARQVIAQQLVFAEEPARRADPARLPVVRPRADTAVRVLRKMNPHAAPVRSLRKDLECGGTAQPREPDALAGSHEALRRQFLCAHGLDVFIQNLGGRRLARSGPDNVLLLIVRRPVQFVEGNRGRRSVLASMAGPASYHLRACEVVLVDRRHHIHHLPGHPLLRLGVANPIHRVRARSGMTVGAIVAHSVGHHAHRAQKIARREALQRGGRHVLEELPGCRTGVSLRRLPLPKSQGRHTPSIRPRTSRPSRSIQPSCLLSP